ncbi:hypothetical protein GCM10027059_45790 [Myceligenerans halotolerans]
MKPVVVKIVAAVVFGVYSIGMWVTSGELDVTWLRWFSAATFVAIVFLTLWDLLLWRHPWAQKLPGTPRNVRGTWQGKVISLWVNPETGRTPPPIEAYLVVRQTSTTVNVSMMTAESRSTSSPARVSATDGSVILDYLYMNRPRASVQNRSPMHHGSVILDVSGTPAHRLSGRYWTERDSKGELYFENRSAKIADDFEDARALFTPDTTEGTAA